MSAYRNDLDAALARNHDLERRVQELEAVVAGKPATPAVRLAPTPPPTKAPSLLVNLVENRERELRRLHEQKLSTEEYERDQTIKRYARRPVRIGVSRTSDTTRITIKRPILRVTLAKNAVGGFVVSTFSIGIFVIPAVIALFVVPGLLPLPLGVLVGVATWAAIIFGINVLYAYATTPSWHLDLADNGVFALHDGDPRCARLLGRTPQLVAKLDKECDPSRLHDASFIYNNASFDIDHLTDRDVSALRYALTPYVQFNR